MCICKWSGSTPAPAPQSQYCIRSTTSTGYSYSDVNENLLMSSFSVTGLKCASGYEGNPVATKCAANGEPYTVSGCSKIPSCIRSTTTTGYDYSDVNENLLMNAFSVTGLKSFRILREIRLQLNALLMANRISFLGVVKYLLASEVQQLLVRLFGCQ